LSAIGTNDLMLMLYALLVYRLPFWATLRTPVCVGVVDSVKLQASMLDHCV